MPCSRGGNVVAHLRPWQIWAIQVTLLLLLLLLLLLYELGPCRGLQ